MPDSKNPQQFNRYAYTLNNPIKYTDPSGHCAEDRYHDAECWEQHDKVVAALGGAYANDRSLTGWSTSQLKSLLDWLGRGVVFAGKPWTGGSLGNVRNALDRVMNALGDRTEAFLGLLGGTLTFNNTDDIFHAWQNDNMIKGGFNPSLGSHQTDEIIHEIGHLVDWHVRPDDAQWGWSMVSTEWKEAGGWWYQGRLKQWIITAEGKAGAPTVYAWSRDPGEDIADTFATVVDQQNGLRFYRSILVTQQSYQNFQPRVDALKDVLGLQ